MSLAYPAPNDQSSDLNNGWEVYLDKQNTNTPKNLTPFLQQCLYDFSKIKVGMTRVEIEKMFPYPGGINGVSPTRFIHPRCDFFVIEVTFDFKRDLANQGRAIEGKDDKVTAVSRPFIEYPASD